ncbi:hypothetical protein L5515_017344 [Caenorhabditis briggsae]|uniref:Uncharacterized protein n=1 Tax=Caenorhabditis briggsae TaxID=6238 RepID=A0AAE9FDI6_CAEBR|nr:hypothetical protein L5515_017344 [Caenorhabditis briggsae]
MNAFCEQSIAAAPRVMSSEDIASITDSNISSCSKPIFHATAAVSAYFSCPSTGVVTKTKTSELESHGCPRPLLGLLRHHDSFEPEECCHQKDT